MIQKKTLATTLSGVVIGGLLLSGGMAFAGDAKDSVTNSITEKVPFFGQFMGHQGERGPGRGLGMGLFKEAGVKLSQENLDQLVKEGVISQEKADEIKVYIDKTEKEMQARFEELKNLTPEERKAEKKNGENAGKRVSRTDLFTQLVNNNILTQEQADTIKTKLQEMAQEQKQQQLSDTLKALVEKGTITQEQYDKIIKQCEDAEKERKTLNEKLDNMTVKDFRQYMQNNQEKRQNPMEQLVSNGVLTKEQVTAIQKAMTEIAREKNQQRISDGLKALVDKNTITQDQADKILTSLENMQKDRAALSEKIKSMTKEERREYMENNKGKLQDPISQLVAEGTITEDQEKAIQEVVPLHKGFKGPGGKRILLPSML